MMFPFDMATRNAVAGEVEAFVRADPDEASRQLKHAAVALVVAPTEDREASLLLTLRASGLRAHGGQWALPGGRCDAGETPADAALRELDEELGVRLPASDVMGVLDDYPTRSGYMVTPVVMWMRDGAELKPNPDEVASVHRIKLSELARPGGFDFVTIPESDRRVIRYSHFGHLIHAPTAALLYQFSEMLHGRTTRVADLEQPVFAWK